MNEPAPSPAVRNVRVVVATSVMLSFISFWRAAAIVLNDLGSSAYYVGGIAEKAVGASAPWFILAVMLFSYAVRAVYIESCAMFTRGGVYRVVKEAMGGTLAKLSVSALIFDYVLTGPISGVSAGQYIVGLIAQTATYFGHPWAPSEDTVNLLAAGIAAAITVYFWWRNTQGLHESSDDALRIMGVTTVMVVLLIGWALFSIAIRPDAHRLPPAPVPENLSFHRDAVGWMPQIAPSAFQAPVKGPDGEDRLKLRYPTGSLLGIIGLLIAFGHSFLAMSGEESLAQVNRELEHPKHQNLMRAGAVIFVYSLLFTSLVSFFATALIPDDVRGKYADNLISGIAMYLAGPISLKLLFQGFIVVVGFLMLAGAINTSIIGANGVLNRVSEDGVLPVWFRQPHRRYGTTYRLINMIVGLQLFAILASRGNTYTLGEAYAFGVIWSFAFKGLAMLVLRFKDKSPREWKVPFNLPIGGTELPLGLAAIALVLFLVAGINLVTKQVATISGTAFTLVFFALFLWSERMAARRATDTHELEQFRLQAEEEISPSTIGVRPGCTLILVRDYNTLDHVSRALHELDTDTTDLVVMTVRVLKGPDSGYRGLDTEEMFTEYEQRLFSRVLSLAEKVGKSADLMVVPATNVFDATVQTVVNLGANQILMGRSATLTPEQQARMVGQAWERLTPRPKRAVPLRIIGPIEAHEFELGAHAPHLTQYEIDMIHRLWLEVTREPSFESVEHRDIVTVAVIRLGRDLKTQASRTDVLAALRTLKAKQLGTAASAPVSPPAAGTPHPAP